MLVCLCNQVSDKQIRDCIRKGCNTVSGLCQELGIGTNCGCCLAYAAEFIEEMSEEASTGQISLPSRKGKRQKKR